MQHLRLAPICIAASLFTVPLHAQQSGARYEAGISISSLVYQGDLTPAALGSYRTARIGVAAWGSKQLNNAFSLRANLAIGSLRSDDAAYSTPAWRRQRALNFKASLTELSALGVWDVAGRRSSLSPYVFMGAGLAFVKIRRDYSGFNAAYFAADKAATDGLAVDISRNVPRVLPVVPLGAGLRYAITPVLSVNAETAYRLTQTDYIDGFSEVANPDRKDQYQSFSIGILYSFGKRGKYGCPTVR
jgi:opacity protein-like surface antigen